MNGLGVDRLLTNSFAAIANVPDKLFEAIPGKHRFVTASLTLARIPCVLCLSTASRRLLLQGQGTGGSETEVKEEIAQASFIAFTVCKESGR